MRDLTHDEVRRLIIPLPDEPGIDQVLSPGEIESRFGLGGNRRSDGMGHYSSCHWIVVEKKPVGHIRTALQQLEITANAARINGLDVRYLLIITSGKWGKQGQRYENRKAENTSPTGHILINKSIRKGGPVKVSGIDVWLIRESDLDAYLKKHSGRLENFR